MSPEIFATRGIRQLQHDGMRQHARWLRVIALAVFAASAIVPASAEAASASVKCRSFTTRHITVKVYRSTTTSCGVARAVAKAYWGGHPVLHNAEQIHAHQYYTLPKRPGWKCGTGAGRGTAGSVGCSKHKAYVYSEGFE